MDYFVWELHVIVVFIAPLGFLIENAKLLTLLLWVLEQAKLPNCRPKFKQFVQNSKKGTSIAEVYTLKNNVGLVIF